MSCTRGSVPALLVEEEQGGRQEGLVSFFWLLQLLLKPSTVPSYERKGMWWGWGLPRGTLTCTWAPTMQSVQCTNGQFRESPLTTAIKSPRGVSLSLSSSPPPGVAGRSVEPPCSVLALKGAVLKVLLSQPGGVAVWDLERLFCQHHGWPLELRQHGYHSLQHLLGDMADLVVLAEEENELQVRCQHPTCHLTGTPMKTPQVQVEKWAGPDPLQAGTVLGGGVTSTPYQAKDTDVIYAARCSSVLPGNCDLAARRMAWRGVSPCPIAFWVALQRDLG